VREVTAPFLIMHGTADPTVAFSEGMNFPELVDLMLSFGAYTAMSLDGGGSSTMVIEGRDGAPRVLNTLIDEGVPGRERAVANHLGIFIRR